MIAHRRSPRAWVFSIDHDAVQICWRGLQPGTLRIEPHATTGAALGPAIDLALGSDTTGTSELRAAGGAHTVPHLPGATDLDLRLSGDALADPVVLRTRTLTGPPGEELVRIATISDLHLGATTFGLRGTMREDVPSEGRHPWRCAQAAVDEAARWGATRIIAKGDLTHSGLSTQWRTFAHLVREASVPIDAIVGNHDVGDYGGLRSLPADEAAAAFGIELPHPVTVRDLPGLRLILGDTTIAGDRRGTLRAASSAMVEAAADAPTDAAVLVAIHHHLHRRPLPDGPPLGIARTESTRFLDQLGAAHAHALVTSGHSHRNRRWQRAGVTVTQVSATKDYPGVWAGYRVHEGGLTQVVRRVERPDCVAWTDQSRLAAFGLWEHASPGRLDDRCFGLTWAVGAGGAAR